VQLSGVAARLDEFANRYPSLKEAPVWGIAVSGGADSTALLLAARELGKTTVAMHMNYGLRGEESDGDEQFVKDLAERIGSSCEVKRVKPENQAEETLRELRYRWCLESGVPAILTGHCLEDQAETVMHRILRGSGPEGLRGILPVYRKRIFRPLLGVRREELRAFLQQRHETWREDSSNRDERYRRNWLRHSLLPEVRAHLNPEADAALARAAQVAQDEEDWLGGMVDDLLPHFASHEAKGWILEAELFAQAPVALQRRILRAIFDRLGSTGELGFDHVEEARGLCLQDTGDGRKQLPGLDLMRSFGQVRVVRQCDLPSGERNFRLELKPGQEVRLPYGEGIVQTTVEEISQYNERDDSLDWDEIQGAIRGGKCLELRNWRPGEEYQRVGRDRPDKLKELFQKFRIPLWQRRSWPIVVLDDAPIWARSFGPAAGFAARAESKRVLRVVWLPEPRESAPSES
jgi:tRNA(Ile)-lysidine synthase